MPDLMTRTGGFWDEKRQQQSVHTQPAFGTLSRPTGVGLRRGRIVVRGTSTAASCLQLDALNRQRRECLVNGQESN